MTSPLRPYAAASAAFLASHPAEDDPRFEKLALDLFAFQFERNPAYRSLCERLGSGPANVSRWQDIPAASTTAFKELELTVLQPSERTAVFHSSGTSRQRPSRHFHNPDSLDLYKASLLAWAEPHLRLKADGLKRLVFLTPPPDVAPHSSLVHMLETLAQTHGNRPGTFHGTTDADGAWHLNAMSLLGELSEALEAGEPIALFGTAFNFVHLLDELASRAGRLRLPPGSRLMETGGYKGRTRAIGRDEFHRKLSEALGVPREFILTEYGMSELSSQAYDTVAGATGRRLLKFPPWARAQVISPEDGRPVPEGGTGLLRIFDLANVASVLAIQTEDLAVRRGGGFELIGRVTASEPRGCSLMPA